ncbi:PPOX class F420-dependent oxidoreductase [Nonomuraea sp. NPDC046570]|uniref:PPOX class F420-dependent oxidoreductase n=1 Tax=Nonomuraea sp. NPDC046570 TaxID=3155255 RepID=UPI0033F04593
MAPARMNDAEWRQFLLSEVRTAKVAVIDASGSPHVTPVCFTLDGGDVVFITHEGRLKQRAMRRDPRIALCVDDERPPFRFVMLRGKASLDDDPASVARVTRMVCERYFEPESVDTMTARFGRPDAFVVRLALEQVVATRDLAG